MKDEQFTPIWNLVNKRKIYHNKDCFIHISRKELYVLYFILKTIGDKSYKTTELYNIASKSFNEFIVSRVSIRINEAREKLLEPSKYIKDLKDEYWIIYRNKNTKKYLKTKMTEAVFTNALYNATPLFIFIQTTRNKVGFGQSRVYTLNNHGKEALIALKKVIEPEKVVEPEIIPNDPPQNATTQ